MTAPAHVSDSRLLGHLFSTAAMKAIWSDEATLAGWLKVEAALARVQASLGVIPSDAGTAVERACAPANYDLDELGQAIAGASHPLTPVIAAIERNAGSHAAYVHFGATTQDIMDTGTVLQVRDALALVLDTMSGLRAACVSQAQRWRDLPMAGRTHGQHAVPITLGLKFALWAHEADARLAALAALESSLPVQFAGAAGTLATLPDTCAQVRAGLADALELEDPQASWHTSRGLFASLVSQLAITSALCGQIANEIVNLQRTEIGELAEGAAPGAGGSSTMPQKRNPMMAQNVVALARLMAAKPAAAIEATMHEHERDMAAWTMEWAIIPESFLLTHAALHQTAQLVENIVVYEDRIADNLHATGGLICAEAVMMDLACDMGRNEAHHVVKDIIAGLAGTGQPFAEALLNHPGIAALRTRQQIDALLDPANYTGEAVAVVDRIVAELG
jgi:3-carboxy-cis,cis-muconate cycloisomerase